MEQNKIKKGESTWFDNFSSYWITNHNNAPIAIACAQSYGDAEIIADKVVSACNATYGAGINPEAVSDLRDALQSILLGVTLHPQLRETAEAAIEKAKL